MLLFISMHRQHHLRLFQFQYISCYCLSQCVPGAVRRSWISIHLMLLFIDKDSLPFQKKEHFNTSHVTVYLSIFSMASSSDVISIHLMLLFIIHVKTKSIDKFRISIHLMLLFIVSFCYCRCSYLVISIHLMLLFIMHQLMFKMVTMYFNTSHVTVYHDSKRSQECPMRFQYISCYCLSFCICCPAYIT